MDSPPSRPSDLLEQAHLELLRGHLGLARAILERLVILEPGNTEAEDLRATVIAKQAATAETDRLLHGQPPAARFGWAQVGIPPTRPASFPFPALVRPPSAGRTPARRVGPLLSAVLFFVPLVINFWPWHRTDSHDAEVARGLVDGAYRLDHNGSTGDIAVPSEWEGLDRKYGRVVAWHVRGTRWEWLNKEWRFDVDVTREHAGTEEQVGAMAGPSSLYGYYSSITGVTVQSIRAIPKG